MSITLDETAQFNIDTVSFLEEFQANTAAEEVLPYAQEAAACTPPVLQRWI